MAALPTPRDLPGLRHDLAAWYATDAAAVMLAALAGAGRGDAGLMAARHRAGIQAAGMYFVNGDMTDLAVKTGAGLDTFAVLPDEDLPEEHGLLMWSRRFIDPEADGLRFAPLAVAWSAAGGHVRVTLYDHLPTAQPAVAEAYRARFRSCGTPAVSVPGLVQMWESRMRADGRERPWAATPDTDPDSHRVMRTLLATWLLIRQPADARRALHETEEVPAPKADQNRIARGGGDPARTVRYVTLRQALRRDDDSRAGGPEHADRIYRHRWFVRPHRTNQYYPSTGEHQRIWRGPYLVVPAGCENAPILGTERVNVLRRLPGRAGPPGTRSLTGKSMQVNDPVRAAPRWVWRDSCRYLGAAVVTDGCGILRTWLCAWRVKPRQGGQALRVHPESRRASMSLMSSWIRVRVSPGSAAGRRIFTKTETEPAMPSRMSYRCIAARCLIRRLTPERSMPNRSAICRLVHPAARSSGPSRICMP